MNNKERMTIKKRLRYLGKYEKQFNQEIYDYFLSNVKNIGFTDREIGYLIFDILDRYNWIKNDFVVQIVDFLFTQSITKYH